MKKSIWVFLSAAAFKKKIINVTFLRIVRLGSLSTIVERQSFSFGELCNFSVKSQNFKKKFSTQRDRPFKLT